MNFIQLVNAQLKLNKQVFSNAATQQNSANLLLNGSIGQSIIFTSSANATFNQQGFWPGYQKVFISRSEKVGRLGLKLYPNPVSEIITIESKEANLENIQIYDLYGNEIQNVPVSNGQSMLSLNLSHLSASTYFLYITNSKGSQKVMVIKL